MNEIDLTPSAHSRPSNWFKTFGLCKHAEARDGDGFITIPGASDAASLSLYGAIHRSFPNDTPRWLLIAKKLDALLAELHNDHDLRMRYSWLPDSRFDRIARANDHPEFNREDAIWLLTTIGE